MEQEKKSNSIISKVLMFVGIVIIITCIIVTSSSISNLNKMKAKINSEYNQAMIEYEKECDRIDAEYETAYDEWHDAWWNHTADLNDMPDKESYPQRPIKANISGFQFGFVFAIPGIVVGIVLIIAGASQHFSKFSLNHHKEIIENSEKNVTDIHETTDNKNVRVKSNCEYCGGPMDKKSNKCKYCGRER